MTKFSCLFPRAMRRGEGSLGRGGRGTGLRALSLALVVAGAAALAAQPVRAEDQPPPAGSTASSDSFLDKFVSAYKDHLSYTGENLPPPSFRGAEQPLDSPPWPGADYSFGGGQVIGHDATVKGPLTDAIWDTTWGQSLKDNRISVYGWVEPSMNISTNNHKYSASAGNGGNYPVAYDSRSNNVELDQFALYVERVPDEVQTDHVDWGFRVSNLYGEDYRFTFAHDNNSSSWLKKHHLYGDDPCIMCYGEIYVPDVAEGMNIRVGRYISIPDIEAQLAPNNYTFTHSLLYTYDPYTQTGIVDSIKLSRNWTIQLELSGGNDIMPWDSRYTQLTPAACVEWTSNSGGDVIYPCVNGINSQKYGYNNIQHMVNTWYHKFNSQWHMDTETWYMWEKNVPNENWNGASGVQTTPILGANESYCGPNKANCFAREYAFINYINYEINPLNGLSFRNGFFNDVNGQRTGVPTWYSEHGVGWQHWLGDVITIRPELLYVRSYNQKAFNASATTQTGGPSTSTFPNGNSALGTARQAVVFSTDMIVHF